ncbi:hypothetical protein BRM3_08195 [Brachybacterium huguangmaarense]|uniref:Head-tail adaptor protein n=1 Tax=Brachybacterium huguangmaarense TaxID=1652028 RepID=A0ABY6FXH9_9MICO|nr:hypothetical protein [Brachybacterium huguangmaarense]UYG15629.1 hypothetical protein BRM3_08195 [Brachybacterium huguangmaarense]
MIGHTKIVILRKGGEIGRDRYGNPIYGPDVEETVYGEFSPLSTDDLNEPNRDAVVIRFRLILPATAKIDASSKISALGTTLEVIGQPMPILWNGSVHHYELIVEQTTG